MSRLALAALACAIFVFSAPSALAQSPGEGTVYSIDVSPEQPNVFDPVSLSVGARNPSSSAIQYSMDVIVTKDGEIQGSQTFTFTLRPTEFKVLKSSFQPRDIGEYQVVAKLSDVSGDLKDIQVKKFDVVSQIGPFEISVDAPSKFVVPGTVSPVIVTLANMGERATDVEVRLEMACSAGPPSSDDFFVFLNPGAVQDKQVSMRMCGEPGEHDVTASIVVFNRTWTTAVNQMFLNQSTVSLKFSLPDVVLARSGEPKVFDVQVANDGNIQVDDLRLLVSKIPSEWQSIAPPSISSVSPGQSALFIVNITPPAGASDAEMQVEVSAASDQGLSKRETLFRVVGVNATANFSTQQLWLPTSPQILAFVTGNITYIILGASVAVVNFVARHRYRRSRQPVHRQRPDFAYMPDTWEKLRKVSQSLRERRRG